MLTFVGRQIFLVLALGIVFCLGHSVVRGSLFSEEHRERLEQAQTQKEAAVKPRHTKRIRL